MATTTRRHLLKAAAFGGVSATGLAVLSANGETAGAAGQKPGNGNEHAHDNRPPSGKRAHAVVSFGQWDVDPAAPLDRQVASPPNRNVHEQRPFDAEVDAGGAVSFIISGLHQVVVYDDGSTLADVQAGAAATLPLPPIGIFPPLENYAVGRVYRGIDPRVLAYAPGALPANLVLDRVETVNFKEPGRYLVVCGVLPHLEMGMHGFVTVKA